MDVKIDILKRDRETVAGREHINYADYYTNVWATPMDLYGTETYAALNINLENVVVFDVRYCEKIKKLRAHCKDFVIRYEGDIYDIYATSFKKNEKTTVTLKANRSE